MTNITPSAVIKATMTGIEVLLKVKKLHPNSKLPHTWNDHNISLDLFAHLMTEDGRSNRAILPPRTAKRIPTGLSIECAPGYCLLPLSRARHLPNAIFVMDHLLLFDPDYKSELFVTLYNGGHDTQYIEHEENITTVVAFPYRSLRVLEVPL